MIVSLPEIDPERRALGERVRRLREARGLSRLQLARALEVTPAFVAGAEQGRARFDASQLHRVVLALHVPTWMLFEPGVDLGRLRRL